MSCASQLLNAHLCLKTRDFETWKSLFPEDAVMEYVYGATANIESPLVGIGAIAKSVSGFLEAVGDFRPGEPSARDRRRRRNPRGIQRRSRRAHDRAEISLGLRDLSSGQ
jgi:hypothetical protein